MNTHCCICGEINETVGRHGIWGGNNYCSDCADLYHWTNKDPEFTARAAAIGIKRDKDSDWVYDNWMYPYGANIDPKTRIRLVDWAEAGGYRYQYKTKLTGKGACCLVHWMKAEDRRGKRDRCPYDSVFKVAMDHVSAWTGPEGRFIISQPYAEVSDLEAAAVLDRAAGWAVDVSDRGWYLEGVSPLVVISWAG